MTVPATFFFDAPGGAQRSAELRWVKSLTTLVLMATLLLFVTAKLLLPVHPAFGFVAAFAEAATIGGLADLQRRIPAAAVVTFRLRSP